MRNPPSRTHGFSLLEILVVVAIIGILAVLVAPAVSGILRGSQLTQGGQIVADQLKLARQLALTKSRSVEVRLIRYGDPGMPGESSNDPSTGFYRAIQIFQILESGLAAPLGKPELLPQAVIINSGGLSTLISHPSLQPPKEANPNIDPAFQSSHYQFVSFRFLPDGSTSLSTTSGESWYMTLHNINDKPAGTTPPNNFITLQVDPVSGTTKMYRPSL